MGAQPAPSEEEYEARERYRELLEELRTILPGVQVLFAFLLTSPFSARFPDLDRVGRNGFAVALVSAALSTTMFVAPTAFHRIAPREERERRVRVAVRLTLAGMLALLVSMASALFVVARFIYGTREGLAVVAAFLATAGLLWYLLPLRERLRG